MDRRRLLEGILAGSKNVSFSDLQSLAEGFGFQLIRISGSHHIFAHPNLPDILNLQPRGRQAKPYQIRQLLKLIEEYNLTLEDEP